MKATGMKGTGIKGTGIKGIRRKLKKSLAAFLAFCITMTSLSTEAWASEISSQGSSSAVFTVSGEELKNSAQAAIEEGTIFHFEDLETAESSAADQYEKLFAAGNVYEFSPAMDVDSELSDVELRMFVQVKTDKTGHRLTGDEKIMLLFINMSEEKANFRLEVDGKAKVKASVKANSFEANAVPPIEEDDGAESTAPGESTGVEKPAVPVEPTEAEKEPIAPEDKVEAPGGDVQAPEDTGADTGVGDSTTDKGNSEDKNDSGSKDNGSSDGGSKDNGSSDGGSKDNGSSDGGSKDNGSSDGGSKDNGSSDGGSKDNGSSDGGSKDNGSGDSGSKDNGSSDGGSKDNGSSDGGNKDSGSGDNVSVSIVRKYAPRVATALEQEPAKEETKPVKEETEPVKEETEPVKEETEPVKEETEPVKEETEAATESAAEATESAADMTEATEAAADMTEATEPAETEETTKAATETESNVPAESSAAAESTEAETLESEDAEEEAATGGYKLVKVYNDCNAKLYVTTLKDLGVEFPAAEDQYTLRVIHRLSDQGGFYVKEEAVVLPAQEFNEEGIYEIDSLKFQREGMEFVKANEVAIADAAGSVLPDLTMDYRVADGYQIVSESVKGRSIFKGELTDQTPEIKPVEALVTIQYVYQGGLTAKPTETLVIYQDNGVIAFSPVTISAIEGYTASIATDGTDTDGNFVLAEDNILSGSLKELKAYRVVIEYRAGVTPYTVEHWFQDDEAETGYTRNDKLTESLSSNIGDMTKAEAKTVKGFRNQPFNQVQIEQEPIVIQIMYDKNELILNFDTNGGSYVDYITGKYGAQVTISGAQTPVKAGYTLEGWYTEKSLAPASKVKGSIELTEDTTLYAKWTPAIVNFTVVYLIQNANDDGYTMLGYDDKWSGKTGDEVRLTSAESKTKVEAFFKTQELEAKAFTFAGSEGGTLKADGTTVITAKYNRNKYSITFGTGVFSGIYTRFIRKTDGAVVSSFSIEGRYQENISAEWKETLDSYWVAKPNHVAVKEWAYGTGQQWKDQKAAGMEFTEPEEVWNQHVYEETSYNTQEQGVIADKSIDLVGHSWLARLGEGPGSTNSFWQEQEVMGYGDTTITYSAPKGSVQRDIEYYQETLGTGDKSHDGKNYKLSKAITYKGYDTKPILPIATYRGKYQDSYTLSYTSAEGYGNDGKMHKWPWPAGSTWGYYSEDKPTEFYYDLKSFTLSRNISAGNSKDIQMKYTSSLADLTKEPTVSEKPHPEAQFEGWFIDPDFKVANTHKMMPSSNLRLYAKWSYPEKTLELKDSLAKEDDSKSYQTFKVKLNAKAPTDQFQQPDKDGYVFTGWYKDRDAKVRFDYQTLISTDTVIYAGWKNASTVPYSVRYVTADGTEVADGDTGSGAVGTTIHARAKEPKAGFEGYVANAPSQTITLTEDGNANVITFTYKDMAEFQYAIRYVYGGSEIYTTAAQTSKVRSFRYYPKEFTVGLVPELVGYQPGAAYVQADMTTELVTIDYPVSPISYSIEYKDLYDASFEDGKVNPSEYNSFTESFTLANPSRKGYDFMGWTNSQHDGGAEYNSKAVLIEKGSQGKLTFTATWKAKTAALNIRYQYARGQEGSEALPSEIKADIVLGQSYSHKTPVISGYLPDDTVVTGTPATTDPISITVTYKKIQVKDAEAVYNDQPHTINPEEITGADGAKLMYAGTANGPWSATPAGFTDAKDTNPVYVQVTKDDYVTVATGNVKIAQKPARLKAAVVNREYNGNQATAIPDKGSPEDLYNQTQLLDGHWFVVDAYEGEATDATTVSVKTLFTKVSFYKGSKDAPVNVTPNYKMDPIEGSINITNSALGLDFAVPNIYKTYDGVESAIQVNPVNPAITEVNYTYKLNGNPVNESELRFTKATTKETEVTVTASKANYTPVEKKATVTIKKRRLTATSQSKNWIITTNPVEVNWPHATAQAASGDAGILAGDEIKITESTKINTNTLTAPDGVENRIIAFTIEGNAGDVTANYLVDWMYGRLTVTKDTQQLIVEPGDKTVDFDGATHKIEPRISNNLQGELVYSETIDGTYQPMSSYAGKRNVTASGGYQVYVKAISNIYADSEPVKATLTVNPMKLKLETESGSWPYDGASHGNDKWSFKDASGNVVASTPDQATVSAGTVTVKDVKDTGRKNTASWYFGANKDDALNQNYLISPEFGTLTITSAENPVTLEPLIAVYDGTEKFLTAAASGGTSFDYSTDGGLTWKDKTLSGFAGAGVYDIMVKAHKENYNDSTAQAQLTITQRPIGIRADRGEKKYDTKPLTAPGASVEALPGIAAELQGLAPGQTLASVKVVGERTDIGGGGALENIPSEAVIKAGNEPVSIDNYAPVYLANDLVVTPSDYKMTVIYKFAEVTGTVALPPREIVGPLNHGAPYSITTPDLTGAGYIADIGTVAGNIVEDGKVVFVTYYKPTVTDVEATYDGTNHYIPNENVGNYPEESEIRFAETADAANWSEGSPSYTEANRNTAGGTVNEHPDTIFVQVTKDGQTVKVPVTVAIKQRPISFTAYSTPEGGTPFTPGMKLNAITEVTIGGDGLVAGQTPSYLVWSGEATGVTDKLPTAIKVAEIRQGDAVKTDNYAPTFIAGQITVTAAAGIKAELKAEGKVYDGTPIEITAQVYDKPQGENAETTVSYQVAPAGTGGYQPVEGIPVLTEAGSYSIKVIARTPNYADAEDAKTVTITKRPVTITVEDVQEEYTSAIKFPFKSDKIRVEETDAVNHRGLLAGHTVTGHTTSGAVNSAADMNKPIENKLNEGYDIQVTGTAESVLSNYAPNPVSGTIQITTGKKLQVVAEGYTIPYDGTVHTLTPVIADGLQGEIKFVESESDKGDDTKYKSFSEFSAKLDAGTYPVYLKAFSDTYADSDVKEAVIVIERLKLELQSADGSKVYDGTPLRNPNYSLSPQVKIPDGDNMTVSITGSVTDVTEGKGVENTIASYQVMRGGKNITTLNYAITPKPGYLSISKADGSGNTVAVDDKKGTYNGDSWSIETPTAAAPGSDIWYSKDKGSTWSKEKPSFINANEAGYEILVKAVNKNYADTEPVTAKVTILKRPLVVQAYSATEEFYPGINLTAVTQISLADETSLAKATHELTNPTWSGSANTVTEGEVTSISSIQVMNGGEDLSENYAIRYRDGKIIITASANIPGISLKGYTRTYDALSSTIEATGGIEEETDFTYYVKKDAEAEIQVNGLPQFTDAGIYQVRAEAVTPNYVTKTAEATVTVEKRPVTITAKSAALVYSDSITFPYKLQEVTWTEETDKAGLLKQHSITDVITSGQVDRADINKPDIANSIVSYKLVDGNAADVAPNYDVKKMPGSLYIGRGEKLQVNLSAEPDIVLYDGTDHTITASIEGGLEGTIKYVTDKADRDNDKAYEKNVFTGLTGLDAGSYTVYLKAFSDLYEDSAVVEATLTIKKRPISILSDSDKRPYNGQPLTALGHTYIDDTTLAEKDTAKVNITGTVTDVTGPDGVPNTIKDIQIFHTYKDGAEKDVAALNYEVNRQEGALVITRAEGNGNQLTVKDNEGTYNGDSWSIETPTATAPGSTIWYSTDGGSTWSKEKPSFTEANEAGHEILVKASNDNYDDTEPVTVKVTIHKRPLTVTANSSSKKYDTTPLTDGGYSLTEAGKDQGLVSGHKLNVTISGSVTEVSEVPNVVETVAITADNEESQSFADVTTNYAIVKVNGTLTIEDHRNLLEITYRYHEGEEGDLAALPAKYNDSLRYQTPYSVPTKAITGYVVNWTVVEGTMMDKNIAVDVIYHKDENGNGKPDCDEDKHKITFLPGDRGTLEGTTVFEDILTGTPFNKAVTVPQTKASAGYKFAGWIDTTDSSRSLPGGEEPINGSKIYEAQWSTISSGGGGGNNGGGGGGNRPGGNTPDSGVGPGHPDTETINPEEVPLASLPNLPTNGNTVVIDDGEVPLANLPKTGDRSASKLQLSALLSGLLMGLYFAMKKKEIKK